MKGSLAGSEIICYFVFENDDFYSIDGILGC
jgi:hypothetical protein